MISATTKQMDNQLGNRDLLPWYKQFWPWFLISLPATIVVAGIFMIIMAVRSPFALVEDDYYKEGLGINADLARTEHARELGIKAELLIDENLVRLDLNHAASSNLSLEFIHPTNSALDKTYPLQAVGDRRFIADIESLIRDNQNVVYRIYLSGISETEKWRLSSQASSIQDGTAHTISMTANQEPSL